MCKNNILPRGDHTPANFILAEESRKEKIKKIIRRYIYPVYNKIVNIYLKNKYSTSKFSPDLWLLGQRGNDYERHRRRVSRITPLKNKRILIAGCGTAKDVESWVEYKPQKIIGIDWFNYDYAWEARKETLRKKNPEVSVDFRQADLASLDEFMDESFDVVGSDAVFEHVKKLPTVLEEFYRVLKPGGVLYATYGPLWYSWGGDHVSGFDLNHNGYNHLLLKKDEYDEYISSFGEYIHSEHDGRTWIENDLFSRLSIQEYIHYIERLGFKRKFIGAMVEPRALTCLNNKKFNKKYIDDIDDIDLIVGGMTIIYQK